MSRVSDIRSLRATGWHDRADVLHDVARFNLCLAAPSRAGRWALHLGWASEEAAGPAGLWTWPAARAAVSSALMSRLQHPPCFDPQRPEWPLALLPEPEFGDLCRHLSAVLMHRRVRQTLSRVEVLCWRNWLGPAAWRLAMEGAALLPVLPVEPAVDPEQVSAESLGLTCLWQASIGWDPAIAERWRLRHEPPSLEWMADVPPERAHRTAMAVLFAVHPRWFSRFAR